MGILLNLTKEYFKDEIRKEDGIKVNLYGKKYIMKFEDISFLENLIPLNDNGDLYIEKKFDFFEEPVYIFISTSVVRSGKDYFNCHYITKKSLEYVKDYTIEEEMFEKGWIFSNYKLNEDNFLVLRILHKAFGGLSNSIIDFECDFYIENREKESMFDVENKMMYKIFKNREAAISEAEDRHYENLCKKYEEFMYEDDVNLYIKSVGDEWIDKEELTEYFYEKYREEKYDDLEYKDGEHGNKLNDLLIENGVIENTSEYFHTDLEKPKFNIKDYRDKLIEKTMRVEDVPYEEAVKIVDGYEEWEFIEKICFYNIVQNDENFFELDYDSISLSTINKAIKKLIDNVVSESGGIINATLDNYGSIPESTYDLTCLAKISLDKNNIVSYLSNYDDTEYNCEIDGNEYFVYIIED